MSLEDDHGVNLREGNSEPLPDISSCVPCGCDCQCCMNITIPYHSLMFDSKVSHVHQSNEHKKGKLKAYCSLVGMKSIPG